MAQDFISVQIIGERTLTRNLDHMPDTVRAILLAKVESWTAKLRDKVEENIINRLNQKSGKLLEGVQMEVTNDGLRVEGRVYIAGVPYAAAQEKGAVTPPHMIFPQNGKVLAFIAATGDKVFATRVFHPGGQILPKHYMKDAYREMGPEISRGIKNAVVQGIRENMRRGR